MFTKRRRTFKLVQVIGWFAVFDGHCNFSGEEAIDYLASVNKFKFLSKEIRVGLGENFQGNVMIDQKIDKLHH